MGKRVLLGGVAVVVIAVAVAAAQIFPRGAQAPEDLVTQADDNPFAGLDQIFNEAGPNLGLKEEQQRVEGEYLGMRSPSTETSGAEPLKRGENVPYRTCRWVPEVQSDAFYEKTAEGAATRSIYSYVQKKRVLESRDCTCTGKVAPFDEARQIKADLVHREGADWDRRRWGRHFQDESYKLRSQVVTLCGGEF